MANREYMADISIIEKEILKKFKDDDIKVFTNYDIDACKLKILIERGDYHTRIYYDINKMLNDGLDCESVAALIITDISMSKLYSCDPSLNVNCSKESCYINGGPCSKTRNPNYKNSNETKRQKLINKLKKITSDLENGFDGFLYLYDELIGE